MSPNGYRLGEQPRKRPRPPNGASVTDVVWTAQALRNLDTIRIYIAQFSPLASQRMALRLKASGDSLRDFPERGTPVGGGRRQLTHVPPYLIRYRIIGDRVVILDVRHAAEDAA